jgi:hypothetical protein
MTRLDTLDDSIWYLQGPAATDDLDVDDERAARAAYLQRGKEPGIGVASCYRCDTRAAMHVRLRISSLTPVCAEHAGKLVYALDDYGTLTESGPYGSQ